MPLPDAVRDMIDDLALRACRGLLAMSHPTSGLTLDRTKNVVADQRAERASSVAATGFMLSLLPEFVRHNLITAADAAERAAATMRFVEQHVEHRHGFLRHFVDWKSGGFVWNCEFSVLDTSIFLNGCIVASQAYPAVEPLGSRLLSRVDWQKVWIEPKPGQKSLICYGFRGDGKTHEPGFADVRSSENLMPCILAAGAREHPLPGACWRNAKLVRHEPPLKRDAEAAQVNWKARYEALLDRVVNPSHPLFTSHYGLVWADLAGLHDPDGFDPWANARTAALYNRAYCRLRGSESVATYAEQNGGWWGISAGDSPSGYVAPGPLGDGDRDATAWPTAALAAVPWAEDEFAEDVPRWHKSDAWAKALGPFGLAPFTLKRPWVGRDVIGIDLGCFAGTWGNLLDQSVHRYWKDHPQARAGIEALEFSRMP